MGDNTMERRMYKRVFFSPEDNMSGKIMPKGGSFHEIPVYLMNISVGGVAFRPFMPDVEINKGDRFFFSDVTGRMPIDIKGEKIELVIRWVAEISALSSLGVGAEFIDISDNVRATIENFIKKNLETP